MKHLETFEAACEFVGKDPKTELPIVDHMADQGNARASVAVAKLSVLSEAAWKAAGKTIDWNDYNQYKYYGWFDLETYNKKVGSSASFSCDVCYCDASASGVGSRLCFPDRDTAKYVGDTHLQLYRELMVIE